MTKTMNHQSSKLGSLVGCFDQTIEKNHDNGSREHLLGRTCFPPSKICPGMGRGRRHSLNYTPLSPNVSKGAVMEMTKAKVPRRVSFDLEPLALLVAPPPPAGDSIDGRNVSPVQKVSVNMQAPVKLHANNVTVESAVAKLKKCAQIKERQLRVCAKTNSPPPTAMSMAKNVSTENILDEDGEIQALKCQITKLKAKLQRTLNTEESELLAVEQTKIERMAQFRESQKSKWGLPSEKEAAIQVLRGMDMDKTLKIQQADVAQLRQSNKALRQERHSLASKMAVLRAQNEELQEEIELYHEYSEKVSVARDVEEHKYDGFLTSLPQYRHKIEKLRTKLEQRDSLIHMERSLTDKYDGCLQQIVLVMKGRSGVEG